MKSLYDNIAYGLCIMMSDKKDGSYGYSMIILMELIS
jgi:hypothetical protein